MDADRLTVLITPSTTGNAWRHALTAHASRRGWPVADVGPDGPEPGATGLFFAHQHTAIGPEHGPRVVLIDTSAVGIADPTVRATGDELSLRAHSLVEAELAARSGAVVLQGARYHMEFPVLGLVERAEGMPYRIPASASESPLAMFDRLPLRTAAEANWHPQWFTYPERPDGLAATSWIDMTGRMRALLFGPYIRLPVGRWAVDVRFAVDPERAHAPLLFEWGAGAEYCRVMAEFRQPGTYGVQLDRVWPEADSAQLRIWNYHPVFEGKIEFQGCRVRRVADDDPTPPTPSDHIVELGVF